MTMTLEAGVTTEAAQKAARDAGCFFALDLAAKGPRRLVVTLRQRRRYQIIKYGGMREQVIGWKLFSPMAAFWI